MVTTREDYESLLERFVGGELKATEFEAGFWELFNKRNYKGSREETDILFSYLFGEVDAYCSDPDLRPKVLYAIDEELLKEAATKALEMLRALRLEPPRESWTSRFTKYAKKLRRRREQSGQDQT